MIAEEPPLRGKQYGLFAAIHKQLKIMPGLEGLGQDMTKFDQQTQTPGSATPLERVKYEAEVIANDVINSFEDENSNSKPADKYCKTMRRTVREMSIRHDHAFNAMVKKLNVDESSAFTTFVEVADAIFEDGQINWGRVVVVYTFASRLASHCRPTNPDCNDRIALYAGKYVSSKLSRWILDNGGWDAFADYFPEQKTNDKFFSGLIHKALGFWTMANKI